MHSSGLFVPPQQQQQQQQHHHQQQQQHAMLGHFSASSAGGSPWTQLGGAVLQHEAISVVAFDPWEELLWSGSRAGWLASASPALARHCSWRAESDEVRAVLVEEDRVLSVGRSSVRSFARGGKALHSFSDPRFQDLYSASKVRRDGSVLALGGLSKNVYLFDVRKNRIQQQIGVKESISQLKVYRQTAYVGDIGGTVSLADSRSFRVQSSFRAFNGGIASMDVKDKLLCCSGYTTTRTGSLYLDGVVQVYDLRMLRALQPVPFSSGAHQLVFHPLFSGTLFCLSQTGHLQISDVQNVSSLSPVVQSYQLDTAGALMLSLDISSSGEMLAMGDSLGVIRVWGDRQTPRVNLYSQPSLAPSAALTPPPMMESTPLGFLPVPPLERRSKRLLSDWPRDLWVQVRQPTPPIPSAYLENARVPRDGDFIRYAHVPKDIGIRRNQHPFARPVQVVDVDIVEEELRKSTEAFSPAQPKVKSRRRVDKPPAIYQRKRILYTKLGITGFNFAVYNRTQFCGLENGLEDSYWNAILHMLFFVPQLRNYLASHLCEREFCLSCELGFLFHMLSRCPRGAACHAANLLRTLREIPGSRELNIFDTPNTAFTTQQAGIAHYEAIVRYLVQQIVRECSTDPAHVPGRLLRAAYEKHVVCKRCGKYSKAQEQEGEAEKGGQSNEKELLLDLVYPEDAAETRPSFGSLLSASLSQVYRKRWVGEEWCATCGNKQESVVVRVPSEFPPMLMVSSGLGRNLEMRGVWKSSDIVDPSPPTSETSLSSPRLKNSGAALDNDEGVEGLLKELNSGSSWLPQRMVLSTSEKQQICVEELAQLADGDAVAASETYQLAAILCHIHDPRKFPGRGSPVLLQRITSQHTDERATRGWYLFNDFQILRVSALEAVTFDTKYKNPCVLIYTRGDHLDAVPIQPVVNPVSRAVFSRPNPYTSEQRERGNEGKLDEQHLPGEGDKIAIDTEFVALAPAQSKVLSNGSKVLIRPIHLSLARVSVLSEAGEPLIDDYVVAKQKVYDYLTRFSGISEGDLNAEKSKRYLVPLKNCYLKLRFLVDAGCVFVGHGLTKDFRILNLYVPPEQVRDTVDLFHLPRSRRISLRFLASYLLHMDIQSSNHDSIEDAATALAVYHKYVSMRDEGDFNAQLRKLYDVGRMNNWKSRAELKELQDNLVRKFSASKEGEQKEEEEEKAKQTQEKKETQQNEN